MRFARILAIAAVAFAQPRPFEAIMQAATSAIPRITEADVEVPRDGSLLLAYTEFTGGDGSNWGAARIAARTSRDNGRNWSARLVLVANSGKMKLDGRESASAEVRPVGARLQSEEFDGGLPRRIPGVG